MLTPVIPAVTMAIWHLAITQLIMTLKPASISAVISAKARQWLRSASAETKPRQTAGGPARRWPRSGGSVSGSVSIGNGNLAFQSGDRSRPRPPGGGHHPGPRPGPVFVPGGGWVRDTCHPLPQEEVCARLSDRRYEILRRYGAALPSDRRTLDLEQRGIDARLANDCR